MSGFTRIADWLFALFLFVLLMAVVVPACSPAIQASGNTYYVSIDGDDTNPGTEAEPWRTIQHAAETIVAGDSVVVREGNYGERVAINRSGTGDANIIFRAEAEGRVILHGFNVNGDFVRIRGFEIASEVCDWTRGVGVFVTGSNCALIDNLLLDNPRGGIKLADDSSNCTVRNNRMQGNAMAGLEVHGSNHLIVGNEVWETVQRHPETGCGYEGYGDADGMRFFGSGHLFRQNSIHDISYDDPLVENAHIDCFQTWGDRAGHDVIFEQNYCEVLENQSSNESGHGFMLENANHLIIRNNIIRAYGGVNTGGGGNSNLTIVNNVFANDLSFGDYPRAITLTGVPNSIVKNNIFYDQPFYTISVTGDRSGQEIDHNMAYRSDGGQSDCYEVERECIEIDSSEDLWDVDPNFVDPASGDYHLRAGSPAIDSGAALPEVAVDFDGQARPQGGGYDIGAYEYVGGVAQPTELPEPPSPPRGSEVPIAEPISTPSSLGSLLMEAESGLISPPFLVGEGYVYQPISVDDPSSGGRAAYSFAISEPGEYVIRAIVDAPRSGSNSFYINIDGEPIGPEMIWDIDYTEGFQERMVSWRGSGTADEDEFLPKVFILTAGEHKLILRGREGNSSIDQFTIMAFHRPSPTPDTEMPPQPPEGIDDQGATDSAMLAPVEIGHGRSVGIVLLPEDLPRGQYGLEGVSNQGVLSKAGDGTARWGNGTESSLEQSHESAPPATIDEEMQPGLTMIRAIAQFFEGMLASPREDHDVSTRIDASQYPQRFEADGILEPSLADLGGSVTEWGEASESANSMEILERRTSTDFLSAISEIEVSLDHAKAALSNAFRSFFTNRETDARLKYYLENLVSRLARTIGYSIRSASD